MLISVSAMPGGLPDHRGGLCDGQQLLLSHNLQGHAPFRVTLQTRSVVAVSAAQRDDRREMLAVCVAVARTKPAK
jgi:hypothetical protein